MIREIPQKVEVRSGLDASNGLSLLRRTRTTVFLGCLFAVGSVSVLGSQQKALAASSETLKVSDSSLKLADEIRRSVSRDPLSTLESARRIRNELKRTKIRNVQKSALADSGAVVHRVRSGETLARISSRYGIPMGTLIQTNGLSNPNDIQAKDTLVIPKAQSVAIGQTSSVRGQGKQSLLIASVDDGAILSAPPQDSILPENERTVAQRDLDLEKVHRDLKAARQDKKKLDDNQLALSPTDLAKVNFGSEAGKVVNPEKPGLDLIDIPVAVRGPLPSLPDLELPTLNSTDYLPSEWQGPGSVRFIWPAKGTFTSGYGWRWGRMHRGIDIAAPVGTPVVASAPGVVTYSQYNRGGYGNLVEVTHPDGSLTLYAHNNRNLVRQGQFVSQGQQIAEMGNTGRSTGPHTHFELHKPGRGAINPVQMLGRK